MVALKRSGRGERHRARTEKQERRGGIETLGQVPPLHRTGRRSRNAVVALKLHALGYGANNARLGSRNAVVALKQMRSRSFHIQLPRSRNAVVALKQRHARQVALAGHGSRNAVVALKRCMFSQTVRKDLGKQERRGGIETAQAEGGLDLPHQRSRNAVVALKRWRAERSPRRIRQGSRNAVVALKPLCV